MLKIAHQLVAGWTPAVVTSPTALGFASALTTCLPKDPMDLARALSVSFFLLLFFFFHFEQMEQTHKKKGLYFQKKEVDNEHVHNVMVLLSVPSQCARISKVSARNTLVASVIQIEKGIFFSFF